MKKLKKLLLASIMLVSITLISQFSVKADDFSENRVSTNGLEEVSSIKTKNLTIYGTYFWYGKIKMNTYLYKKYDSSKDTMYYFVFTDTGINGRGKVTHKPNIFKTEYHYFNSKEMNIEIDFSVINNKSASVVYTLPEINYFPCTTEHENSDSKTYSYSKTIGISAGVSNDSANISASSSSTFGYSFTTSTIYNDIEVIANSCEDPEKDIVSIAYLFTNPKNTKNSVPYKGEVLRISSFVFALEDYSKAFTNQHLQLDVNYNGYIYRKSVGTGNCEMKKRIKHTYVINKDDIITSQNDSEQKTSYDVTDNDRARPDLKNAH